MCFEFPFFAVFGSGYHVSNLNNIKWFNDVELLYWGDIDVQGLEILSIVRGYYPNAKSILMDVKIFDMLFENDIGTFITLKTELSLTEKEQSLYELLKKNNCRLEQEKIPFDYVNNYFKSFSL